VLLRGLKPFIFFLISSFVVQYESFSYLLPPIILQVFSIACFSNFNLLAVHSSLGMSLNGLVTC